MPSPQYAAPQAKSPMHQMSRGQPYLILICRQEQQYRRAVARLGSARLGSARLGSARLTSAQLSSAQLSSARLVSSHLVSCLGSARLGWLVPQLIPSRLQFLSRCRVCISQCRTTLKPDRLCCVPVSNSVVLCPSLSHSSVLFRSPTSACPVSQ